MREPDSSGVPNRSLALVRIESRRAIERQTHDLVLDVTTSGVGEMFADWFYDLRRRQLRIYGGLLRFIDLSIARGVHVDVLMKIPGWIAAYIRDGYDNSGKKAA